MNLSFDDPIFEIALRLGAAWLAGLLIGLERTMTGRPAGFRTFGLITVSSALLMMFTVYQVDLMTGTPGEALRIDPQRIAQGIMTGIGFIGAGVVFKEGLSVHGLTSAATVWAAASLGIIIGAGFWWPSILGFTIIIVTLAVFKKLDARLPRLHVTSMRLTYDRATAPTSTDIRGLLDAGGFWIKELSYRATGETLDYRIVACSRDSGSVDRLAKRLVDAPEIQGFEFIPSDE